MRLSYYDSNEGRRLAWQEAESFSVDGAGRVFVGAPEEGLLVAHFEGRRLFGLYRLEDGELASCGDKVALRGPRLEAPGQSVLVDASAMQRDCDYLGLLLQRGELTAIAEPHGLLASADGLYWRAGGGEGISALHVSALMVPNAKGIGPRHRLAAVAEEAR